MRISQAEQIFQVLPRTLGFSRFSLELSPAMAYLELLIEEAEDASRYKLDLARARRSRLGEEVDEAASIRRETHKLRTTKG